MDEGNERRFLDRMKDERSAGLFLYTIGFSSIIIVGEKGPVNCSVLGGDDALFRSIARAPQKTLPLFADTDGHTVYMGDKEKVEKLTATLALSPVEVILDDNEHNIPGTHYTLLSLTERGGRFAFNIIPTDLSEEAVPALVDFLRKRHPRPAF